VLRGKGEINDIADGLLEEEKTLQGRGERQWLKTVDFFSVLIWNFKFYWRWSQFAWSNSSTEWTVSKMKVLSTVADTYNSSYRGVRDWENHG
jgi:hypothetical protein